MYIKEVIIKGFQSHVDTHILLKPGVNIITGNSDSGKTAVFRAIKWVLRNKPSGNAFINKNTKAAYVSIHFSDGSKIERVKSESLNQYNIIDSDGNTETLSDFGVNVPDEVSNKIKMPLLNVDEKTKIDLNFSDQLDGPFLLSGTPRFAAATLGFLVKQDKVDAAIKLTKEQYRKFRSTSNTLIDSIEDNNAKLKIFPDMDKSKKLINTTHGMITEFKSTKDRLTKLTNTKTNLIESNRDIKQINIGLKIKSSIDVADNLMSELEQKYPKREMLIKVNKSYINTSKQLKLLQNALKCEKHIIELDKHVKLLEEKINKTNNINDITNKIKNTNKDINNFKAKIKVYDKVIKLKETVKELFELAVETKNKKNKLENLSNEYQEKINQCNSNKSDIESKKKLLESRLLELKNRLSETNSCPLSGGKFFKECKDLIAKNEIG